MEITLYQRQNKKEPILWTLEQFKKIDEDWYTKEDKIFDLKDIQKALDDFSVKSSNSEQIKRGYSGYSDPSI